MSAQHLSPALWDSARTAEYLGIPARTLDQWSYRGVGPDFYKVGRHRRYRPDAVTAWLEAHRRGGEAGESR